MDKNGQIILFQKAKFGHKKDRMATLPYFKGIGIPGISLSY